MTAQTIQIGSRFCCIYGEANAEYPLLQMTDKHELQSMGSEVNSLISRKVPKSFLVATHWPDYSHFGHPPRQICSTASPLHLRPCGFQDGESLNGVARFRHSVSI